MEQIPRGKCFACDKTGALAPAHTNDGQSVLVGSECLKRIIASGNEGYQPSRGGPRLYVEREHMGQSTATHTAGPWTVGKRGVIMAEVGKVGLRGEGWAIAETFGDEGMIENGERDANAKLIAAAPSLLEALQLVQGFDWKLDDSEHGQEIKRRCLAAIASATA